MPATKVAEPGMDTSTGWHKHAQALFDSIPHEVC